MVNSSDGVLAKLTSEWRRRPWWVNGIWLFCLYMTFIYMPFDLFLKPVAEDEEVWFGFTLHGWAAKATEPLHWAIYAAGAYGFWRMRPWMWPWAALYTGQVVVAMAVWNLLDPRGGLWMAIVSGGLCAVPMVALWRARALFADRPDQPAELPANP